MQRLPGPMIDMMAAATTPDSSIQDAPGDVLELPDVASGTLDRVGITAVLLLMALIILFVSWRILVKRVDDPTTRYRARKIVSAVITLTVLILLILLWAPFSGRLVVLVGFIGVGLALASQSAIASVFGWYMILSSRLYSIGDRVMIGDVRGEIIDITLTRTKLFEIGGDGEQTWISGRQYTGRQVSLANKVVLDEAIYNYSADFEYVWDELQVLIPFGGDWKAAREIMVKIAFRVVESHHERGFEQAKRMSRFYPIGAFDQEIKSYVDILDSGVSLSVRYLSPLQGTRAVRSEIVERLLSAYDRAGIEFAYPTQKLHIASE